MNLPYIHTEEVHNLTAPREIVPEIMKLLNPKSVVDVGCGIGTFLHCFKEAGVKEVLGIDGAWVNRELLHKYLSDDEFLEMDLERELVLQRRYDLVVSLEVAEHLCEKSADVFVKSLVSAGDVIVFSAAVPFQGGQNHINEQWLTYWEARFAHYGYELHDALRPLVWENQRIEWWYKQNMVIFAPKGFRFSGEVVYSPLRNVVHPDLFTGVGKQLQAMREPSYSWLIKSLAKRILGKTVRRLSKQ